MRGILGFFAPLVVVLIALSGGCDSKIDSNKKNLPAAALPKASNVCELDGILKALDDVMTKSPTTEDAEKVRRQIALGSVYRQRGCTEKAKQLFDDAEKTILAMPKSISISGDRRQRNLGRISVWRDVIV